MTFILRGEVIRFDGNPFTGGQMVLDGDGGVLVRGAGGDPATRSEWFGCEDAEGSPSPAVGLLNLQLVK